DKDRFENTYMNRGVSFCDYKYLIIQFLSQDYPKIYFCMRCTWPLAVASQTRTPALGNRDAYCFFSKFTQHILCIYNYSFICNSLFSAEKTRCRVTFRVHRRFSPWLQHRLFLSRWSTSISCVAINFLRRMAS